MADADQTASTSASPAPADVAPGTTEAPVLSKSAQKKAARAVRYEETKAARRAAEKERRKAQKRARAERVAAGDADSDDTAALERARAAKRRRTNTRVPFGARVVVDLGFDDRMIEKEIKSLTAQLSYVYAAQRRADTPFAGVLFSQLDGRTRARMEGLNDGSYKRWEGCEWWADGYDALWAPDADPRPEGAGLAADGKPGKDETAVTGASAAGKARASAPQASVVYLTADSPHELSELSPDETYIIGGVCDRNRYKNLCLDKAVATGVRHARLPIGTYLANMTTRKVLTVNQVFEILLKWVETRNWEQAIESVMPKRKLAKDGGSADGDDDAGEDEHADAHVSGDGVRVLDASLLLDDDGGIDMNVPVRPDQRAGFREDTSADADLAERAEPTDPALTKPGVEVVANDNLIRDNILGN